jgi:hypothetical protein
MRVLGFALLAALCGYVAGVLVGVFFVNLSSSRANKGTEAAMTGFFYAGPALAVVGFFGAFLWQTL